MVLTAGSVAAFAALLADTTRTRMCLALLDGRAWTAGELARHAGVARSTASEHLSALVSAGLLAEERQGRHRYLRLADGASAQLLEDFAAAVGRPEQPFSLRSARAGDRLAFARTCYDHLAGTLGVAIFDALTSTRYIATDDGLALTPAGRVWAERFLGDAVPTVQSRRPLLRTCLDWTERRDHLGGHLGAALLTELERRAWIRRHTGHRAVTVTPTGQRAFADELGIDTSVTRRPRVGNATSGR